MKKTMNLNGMSYIELVAMSVELQKTINLKREEAIKDAIRSCMETYGVTKEEMKSLLEEEDSIKEEESVLTPEVEEVPLSKVEEIPALPAPQEENKEETKVENKPTSVFDLPVFKEGYNPLKAKDVSTPEPEKTSVEKVEEEIPSMESLLCDDPRYQGFYHPDTHKKKNNRTLPAMDELLSGEPINRILNLGNLNPKGSPYLQHTRVNHVDGIIPTETATGKTLVYLPS